VISAVLCAFGVFASMARGRNLLAGAPEAAGPAERT